MNWNKIGTGVVAAALITIAGLAAAIVAVFLFKVLLELAAW